MCTYFLLSFARLNISFQYYHFFISLWTCYSICSHSQWPAERPRACAYLKAILCNTQWWHLPYEHDAAYL